MAHMIFEFVVRGEAAGRRFERPFTPIGRSPAPGLTSVHVCWMIPDRDRLCSIDFDPAYLQAAA